MNRIFKVNSDGMWLSGLEVNPQAINTAYVKTFHIISKTHIFVSLSSQHPLL